MKSRLLTALATLACAASLALPCAATAWEDSRLHAAPVARPAVAGALNGHARENTVVYELFRKRLLSGTELSELEACTDAAEMTETLCEKTRDLDDAGVLPAGLAEQVLSQTPKSQEAFQRDQDGVSAGSCQQWTDAEPGALSFWRCDAQWLSSSGLVTSYSVTLPAADTDAGGVLEAYRSYLGLDELTDWQTPAVSSPSPYTAALWSAEGQLYLYCTAGPDRFSLGAVSVEQGFLPSS